MMKAKTAFIGGREYISIIQGLKKDSLRRAVLPSLSHQILDDSSSGNTLNVAGGQSTNSGSSGNNRAGNDGSTGSGTDAAGSGTDASSTGGGADNSNTQTETGVDKSANQVVGEGRGQAKGEC